MGLLIAFLTFILVLNCLLLMLLVLIQLPKKEAGAGIAFGAGTTDTLFGAGSGNALTKLTKYSAGLFVCLSLALAMLNAQKARQSGKGLERALNAPSKVAAPTTPPTTTPQNPGLQLQPKPLTPAPAAVTQSQLSNAANLLSNVQTTLSNARPALTVSNPAAPVLSRPSVPASTNAPRTN